jgi:autoinducer 2-degrading protein
MIATIVYVDVLPEYIDAFIDASVRNHEQSVKEPGNLRFDLIQREENPSEFIFYEAYTDEESAAAHKSTSHYLEWRETVAPMMASPRKGVRYTGVRP